MPYISEIFSTPVLTNVMLGCFVAAAACKAVSYHRRMREMQKQNDDMLSVLRQIADNTGKA